MSKLHKNAVELRVRYGRPGEPSESMEMFNHGGAPLAPCQIDAMLDTLRERIFWGQQPYPLATTKRRPRVTYPLQCVQNDIAFYRKMRRRLTHMRDLASFSLIQHLKGRGLLDYSELIRDLWRDSYVPTPIEFGGLVWDVDDLVENYAYTCRTPLGLMRLLRALDRLDGYMSQYIGALYEHAYTLTPKMDSDEIPY